MFELPQSKSSLKQCWVTPRGVVYTLRSVLRGSGILNAHFTGVYILQRGCFSVLFTVKAVEGLEDKQADASTRAFLFVVGDSYLTRSHRVFADNYK